MLRVFSRINVLILLLCVIFISPTAHALDLDWKGYFRADNNYIRNYQFNSSAFADEASAEGGETISGEETKSATFTTFFAKVKPTILVNDNVIIRSEWNIGDPIFGFLGRNVDVDQRNNALTTRRGELSIEAARLWLDVHTDFGLIQIGRAPYHWGLGVIFNAGDGPYDRFQSTSDTIRFVSKFGYLSIMPIYAKVAVGKNLAGAQDTTGAILHASDDVTDFGVGVKFHNPEDDFEAGLLFYKRSASDQQGTFYFPQPNATNAFAPGSNGMSLQLFDFYVRKTWYRLTLQAEIPYYTGTIGDINSAGTRNDYTATGFAGEAILNMDHWRHSLRFGAVPGQGPATTGNREKDYGAMYFHRNYKLGRLLFNYNFGTFGTNNPDETYPAGTTVRTPYDAAISNAKYLMLATENRGEQWSWSVGLVYAIASETAQAGKDFYLHRTRAWAVQAVEDQGSGLGFEIDLGTRYDWDSNISFGADFAMYFPGEFYEFNNVVGTQGGSDMVMGIFFSAKTTF